MLAQSETLIIRELMAYLRINHRNSIDLVSYIEQKKLSPDHRVLLLAQVHRSEVVGIKYKYDGPTVKTILFFKKQ